MGTTGQSITLANSIIGVGILAMPFCFQQCGVLLATLILLSMGLVSRLCCYFLLKSALLARRRNFEFLAFHVFGSAGKLAVEVGIIGFLMGTCIAYFVVVGDLGPQIISKMFNINQSDILRTSIMVIVSLVCVLPLGLLRNVDSLSNVSAATICFYFCLVIKVISEATTQLFAVDWSSHMEMWKPAGVLQCVPIFSMALFCQTQLFEIFDSMPTLSLEKMNVVTKNAINICTAVYFTLGLFGYIAFSSHEISGNILMSLSPTMANDVIKLGFVMSLAFSFPLIIFPCRASLYSFLYKKVHLSQHDHIINHSIPEGTFRCITVAIIACSLFISLLIPNIELVLGLVGSTIGVLICVVFPAACFVNVTFKNTNERVLAKFVLILGLIIMVLGTYANLQAAENTPDKYDERYITQERIDKMVEDFFEAKKSEMSEGVVNKPVENHDPIKNEDPNKLNKEIIEDSEIQPPNPVPPESQSLEKKHNIDNEKEEVLEKKKLKEVVGKEPVINANKQEVDRVSETHPKNLNKINDAKLSNGINYRKNENNLETKENLKTDEIKQMSNQQKIDILKQQQLKETIKQHGEEQKELLKEQKEILHNIMKTKQELQQNKNDAKKIAVESIQKIANMAIQSLNAVSEQPLYPIDKKLEPVANDAVQKIADVAVEAIKEIKDKPIEPIASDLRHPVNQPVLNSVPVGNNVNVNEQNSNLLPEGNNNVNTNEQANPQPVANNIPVQPVESKVNVNFESPIKKTETVETLASKINNMPVAPAQVVNNINKEHSHSPDEPQSYKEGEESQKQNLKNLAHNVLNNLPLPMAINGNGVNKPVKQDNNNPLEVQNDADKNSFSENQNVVNEVPIRHKREVVDCTQKAPLLPEDKEICKTLVGSNEKFQDPLQNVDLNDALPKNLPLIDLNMVHHMRSLKSVDEEKRR